MRIVRNHNGSISIFLILILMPMYTCAYLAIDSAKYIAAKTKINGINALVGNAALANYDKDLKEMYGVFANSNEESNLSSELNDIYLSMVENKTENVVKTSKDTFFAGYVKDESMSNPTILDEQIKEFMKYRAPYNWTRGVSQKLSSFLNIDKISEILKKETKYVEKISDGNELLKQIYSSINQGNLTIAQEKAEKLKTNINAYSQFYEEISESIKELGNGEVKILLENSFSSADEVVSLKKVEELINAIENEEANPGKYGETSLYRYMTTMFDKNAEMNKTAESKSAVNTLETLKKIGQTDLEALENVNLDIVVSNLLPSTWKNGKVECQWSDIEDDWLENIRNLTSLDKAALASYDVEYFTEMFSCLTTTESNVNMLGNQYYRGRIFGGETEYIIFGKDNVKSNLTAAIEMAFAMRMIVNSLYAFTSSQTRQQALSVAMAISGWSGIGVAVTQNLLLLAWSAAESVMDITSLCKGETIPLYKSANTWTLSLSNVSRVLKNGFSNYACNKVEDVFSSIKNVTTDTIDNVTDITLSYMNRTGEGVAENLASMVTASIEKALIGIISSGSSDSCTKEQIEADILEAVNKANNGTAGYRLACDLFVKNCLPKISQQVFDQINGGVALNVDAVIQIGYNELFTLISNEINTYRDEAKEKLLSIEEKSADFVKEKSIDIIESYTKKLSGILGDDSTDMRNSVSISSGIGITYKEYLKIFAIMNYCTKDGRINMLKRCANVMQINCSSKNPNFNLDDAFTSIEIKTKTKVGLHYITKKEVFSY